MPTQGQIIAMGGGGFLMEPENPALDKYILDQARSDNPRVCFVPTASGDSESCIQRFHAAFGQHHCTPTCLSLFRDPPRDIEAYCLEQDVIYVGGGNTRNMLLIWRDRGVDVAMRKAVEAGVVLAGVSAGSICWFEQGITDSNKPADSDELDAMDCLGFLTGSNCPHYDGEPNRRPEYHRLMKAGRITPGLAADDGVGLHYKHGELHAIVSSRPDARAYRVALSNDQTHEETLAVTYLGATTG